MVLKISLCMWHETRLYASLSYHKQLFVPRTTNTGDGNLGRITYPSFGTSMVGVEGGRQAAQASYA